MLNQALIETTPPTVENPELVHGKKDKDEEGLKRKQQAIMGQKVSSFLVSVNVYVYVYVSGTDTAPLLLQMNIASSPSLVIIICGNNTDTHIPLYYTKTGRHQPADTQQGRSGRSGRD